MKTTYKYSDDIMNEIEMANKLKNMFRRQHIKADVRTKDNDTIVCTAKRKTVTARFENGHILVDEYKYDDIEDAAYYVATVIKEK